MSQIQSRQTNNNVNSPDYCPWWYCDETAYIVKWVVVGVLFFLFLAFVIIGYTHAKRRMARGQAPLRYHRWLISRRARARYDLTQPGQNSYGFYRPAYGAGPHGQPQAYPMNNYQYAAPPPAYFEAEAAPVYTPPSKVNPDQSYHAPQGPPPAGYNPAAGSSNVNATGPSQPSRAATTTRNNK